MKILTQRRRRYLLVFISAVTCSLLFFKIDDDSKLYDKPSNGKFFNLFKTRHDEFFVIASRARQTQRKREKLQIFVEMSMKFIKKKYSHALVTIHDYSFFQHSYLWSTSDLIEVFTSHTHRCLHIFLQQTELEHARDSTSIKEGEKNSIIKNIVKKQKRKSWEWEEKI